MHRKHWAINRVNATTVEILLYGFIGEGEKIDDAAFVSDLRQLEASYANINIRINCGGGDVFKGLAIVNAIRASKANIDGYIDGVAASMGAVIAAVLKKVHMSKYARYMTHRVTGGAWGNADDVRTTADEFEALEDIISDALAEKTGLSKEEAKAKYLTDKDRWIGAEQALEEKLVNSIYDAEPIAFNETATTLTAENLVKVFNKTYNISKSNPENSMKELAKLLGLPETATEAEVMTAANKLKSDKESAEARLDRAKGDQAKALVDAAINDKKIVEADREEFETLAKNSYETAVKMLNRLTPAKRPSQSVNPQNKAVVSDDAEGDEPATWADLLKKGQSFVASFKADNTAKYKELYEAHFKVPCPV